MLTEAESQMCMQVWRSFEWKEDVYFQIWISYKSFFGVWI